MLSLSDRQKVGLPVLYLPPVCQSAFQFYTRDLWCDFQKQGVVFWHTKVAFGVIDSSHSLTTDHISLETRSLLSHAAKTMQNLIDNTIKVEGNWNNKVELDHNGNEQMTDQHVSVTRLHPPPPHPPGHFSGILQLCPPQGRVFVVTFQQGGGPLSKANLSFRF